MKARPLLAIFGGSKGSPPIHTDHLGHPLPTHQLNKTYGGVLKTSVRDTVMVKTERKLAKIRREIVQNDKRRKRVLQCIELAIERITTGMSIAELAKRHHLTESKVRRDIENAIFLARSRMFEKTPSRPTSLNQFRQI